MGPLSTWMGKYTWIEFPLTGENGFGKKVHMINSDPGSKLTEFLNAFADRLPVQPADLSHARDASMPQLLGLKSGEQPALAGVHQAHDQVDLLVEGFIRVFNLACAERAKAVIGM